MIAAARDSTGSAFTGLVGLDRTEGCQGLDENVYGPEISWLRWCCQGAVCQPTGRRGSPGGLLGKPHAAQRCPPNVQRLPGIDAHRRLNHPPLQRAVT